jgi:hypothetical protein
MAWLLALPLWGKLALTAVATLAVAIVLCTVIGRPANPHNFAADTLVTTRKAYAADTTRLIAFAGGKEKEADSLRAAAVGFQEKWIAAEQRGAVAKVTASNARVELTKARNAIDSLARYAVLVASQDTVIASLTTALDASHAAFGRLTASNAATIERADSLDAGWRRTRERLALAETALAVEQRRTTCTINLIVSHVKCPSRGVMLVVGVAAGVVGDRLLQKRAP